MFVDGSQRKTMARGKGLSWLIFIVLTPKKSRYFSRWFSMSLRPHFDLASDIVAVDMISLFRTPCYL
jgi:hypothetical protein